MKIYRGIVSHNLSENKNGKLFVNLLHKPTKDQAVWVTYTSPYFNRNMGGMIAIPNHGAEILVIQDDEFNEYYYLSTIVDDPVTLGVNNTQLKEQLINDKLVYDATGTPMSISIKDYTGAGLRISDWKDPQKGRSARVDLTSQQRHGVILSDSPNQDNVIIRNKDGDGITITANSNIANASNTIKTWSKSSQRCIVDNGEYSVTVNDGRDLTLRNNGAGIFGPNIPDPLNPTLGFMRQSGNVNLQSEYKDINISTNNPWGIDFLGRSSGNVYISTSKLGNGLLNPPWYGLNPALQSQPTIIQISSGGKVDIFGGTSVNVQTTTGDISLRALTGAVNIHGTAGVNITAGTNIAVAAGRNIAIQQGRDAEISIGDGVSPVHLNKLTGAILATDIASLFARTSTPVLGQLDAYDNGPTTGLPVF